MLRSRPDLHGQTELFETPNETSGDMGFVSTFEVVGTEFVVRGPVLQDVVRGRQDGCGDGEDRVVSVNSIGAFRRETCLLMPRDKPPRSTSFRRHSPTGSSVSATLTRSIAIIGWAVT